MSEQDDLTPDERDNRAQTQQLQAYYALPQEDRDSLQRIHSRLLLRQRSQLQERQPVPERSAGQLLSLSGHRRKTRNFWSFAALVATLCLVCTSGVLLFLMRNTATTGGETSSISTVPVSQLSIVRVHMTSATTGWGMASASNTASAQQAKFAIRTTDGGKDWQEFKFPQQSSASVNDFFLNDTTAWIIPEPDSANNLQAKSVTLLATHDGGLHWQTSSIPLTNPGITFSDALHGWAWERVPEQVTFALLHTVDGGKTWKQIVPTLTPSTITVHSNVQIFPKIPIVSPTELPSASPTEPSSVLPLNPLLIDQNTTFTFVSPNVGWALGNNQATLYRTSDAGKSWVVSEPNFLAPAILTIVPPKFLGTQDGILGVYMSNARNAPEAFYIYTTNNGGESWQQAGSAIPLSLDVNKYYTQYFTFIDMTHAMVLDHSSFSIYTLKNQRWEVSLTSQINGEIMNVNFIDSRTSWAEVGQISANKKEMRSSIYVTHDGGKSWQESFGFYQGAFVLYQGTAISIQGTSVPTK